MSTGAIGPASRSARTCSFVLPNSSVLTCNGLPPDVVPLSLAQARMRRNESGAQTLMMPMQDVPGGSG